MPRRPLACCGLLAALLAGPAGAAEQEASLWLTATGTLPITERLSATLLVQPRFGDDIAELGQLLVRPWLGWSFTPNLAAALGYDALVVFEPFNGLVQGVWQQLSFSHGLASLELAGRARLEQGIFEDADGPGLRLRLLLGVGLPLPRELTLSLRNEFFFRLVDAGLGLRTGYSEDRVYAGIGHDLGRGVRVEGGYQLQWLNLPGENLFNHIVMIGVSWDLEALMR